MYEDHLREKITNGHQAARWIDDELLTKVLREMEEDIIAGLRIAPPEAVEHLVCMLKAKDDFMRRLEDYAAAGREATREVERLTKQDRDGRH